MKRLTKRLNDGRAVFITKGSDGIAIANAHEKACERLAELEDKFKSGLLIELPCKKGDTIWVVCKDRYDYILIEGFCVGFEFTYDNEIRIVTNVHCYDSDRMSNFTTKESAETRLKELRGE